jgi:YHS domain-containing protein
MITHDYVMGFEEELVGMRSMRCHCGLLYNNAGFLISGYDGTYWFCSTSCMSNFVHNITKIDWKETGF